MFRCKWVKLAGVKVDEQYGMTTVDLNNLGYLDEPFLLAKDVAQVFYVKDMSSKPKRKRKDKQTNTSNDEPKRHIVLSGKETSWESRKRQTCQKIIISLLKFRPSQ